MHGLYVHVPFCLRKCHYCSFVSGEGDDDTMKRWFAALLSETARSLEDGPGITTLYAGGGTPSLFGPERWMDFMQTLGQRVEVAGIEEATIEVNPATCTQEDLEGYRDAGFDRVSLGVQSFSDRELAVLGRIHGAGQAGTTFRHAALAGFRSISLDLIYGFPGHTGDDWQRTLDRAIDLLPDHLSVYELSLDPGTPLFESGMRKPGDETCTELYHQAHEVLTDSGYGHYEVSSYSLGLEERSKHNCGYWNRTPYTGLGPSAHSFDGRKRRWWNTPDLNRYLELVEDGEPPVEGSEVLSAEQQAQEILMLGSRWSEGFDLEDLGRLGMYLDGAGRDTLGRLESDRHVTLDGSRVHPTETGMLLADGIASELSVHLVTGLA